MDKKLEKQAKKTKGNLQQEEVNNNYKYFKENYNEILNKYSNKNFVLLKNQKIIGTFDSWEDAKEAGRLLYEGGNYSIQDLREMNQHLGYQSYALL